MISMITEEATHRSIVAQDVDAAPLWDGDNITHTLSEGAAVSNNLILGVKHGDFGNIGVGGVACGKVAHRAVCS
jgi:hypothetical protein